MRTSTGSSSSQREPVLQATSANREIGERAGSSAIGRELSHWVCKSEEKVLTGKVTSLLQGCTITPSKGVTAMKRPRKTLIRRIG